MRIQGPFWLHCSKMIKIYQAAVCDPYLPSTPWILFFPWFQVHYFIEPFCVSLKRTLPPVHPLNQMLKYHCREVIVPNTFGTPVLLGETGLTAVLFAYGSQGALRLLQDIHPLTTWEVTDYRKNIKVRETYCVSSFKYSMALLIKFFPLSLGPSPASG